MAQNPSGIMQLAGTVRVGGTSIDRGVLSSIHAASRKTGVSFAFMLAKARRESNFQTNAANGASSAQGLYQFTKQTWLEQIKRHGAENGLGALSDQIYRDSRGRYRVDDPEVASAILDLREDHGVSSAMAAEYAADNRRFLTHALGRRVSDTDLYFAHFLGPGGAVEFLGAMDSDPSQDAATLLPTAASANRSIFFGAGGQGRSLGEVHALVERNINASVRRYASAGNLPDLNGGVPLPPGAKPQPIAQGAVTPPEDMGATGDRMASVPLPPGAKPGPENMGAESDRLLASAAPLPRPTALKPTAENMADPAPTEEPLGLPETMMARSDSTETAETWSDQALALTLLNTTSRALGDPSDASQTRAFDAARTFANIAQAGYQWSLTESDALSAPPGDSGTTTLATPGLPSVPETMADRVEMASAAPTTPITEESHRAAPTEAPASARVRAPAPAPKVTASSGAASYAVLAVVESFDPNKRLTSISSPMPGATESPATTAPRSGGKTRHGEAATTQQANPAAHAEGTPASSPPPSDQMAALAPATQAAVLGWFRRVFG